MAEKDGDLNPQIVNHVSGKCPNIVNYWMLGDAGSVTVKGIFVTREGRQTGAGVSQTILIGNGSNPPQQIWTTIPVDAVGFVGNTSGAVRMALYKTGDVTVPGGATLVLTDFTANFANYPLIATGNALNFGSVATV